MTAPRFAPPDSEYPAEAFAPELPGGRACGTLVLVDGVALFRDGDRELRLPLAATTLRLGGLDDAHVFLTDPARPDATVTTGHAIFADPALAAWPALAAQAHALGHRDRRRRHRFVTAVLAFALLLLALLVLPFLLRSWLLDLVVSRIPPGVEVQLGESLLAGLVADGGIVDEPTAVARTAALAAPLLAAQSTAPYPIRVYVADDPAINAFALPGGAIVLNRGLVDRAGRPEEVLGVLAHEVAHVRRRHALRQVVAELGLRVLFATLVGGDGTLAEAAASGGVELASLGYSRDLEREADADAVAMLHAAGIDPSGLAAFLERLRAAEAGEPSSTGPAALALLSTHPATDERLATLAHLGAAEPSSAPLPTALLADLVAALDALPATVVEKESD